MMAAVAVLPMMTIILSKVIISMLILPRGMDVDGTKPIACRGR
jgi:hypothetical protein